MSGGSWDYAYTKLEPIIDRLAKEEDPRRRALGSILAQIKHALHDIEWADSGDYSHSQAEAALTAALGGHRAASVLAMNEIISSGEALLRQMQDLRKQAIG